MMKNFVITIARGFGSGGRAIAGKLADELHIHSYDNRILTLASQLSGYEEHFFREADETLNGSLITKRLLELPKMFHPNSHLDKFVSDDRLFEFQRQIILKLAESESCIIVGKCADYILRDHPNAFSVYVEAPRAYCLERVMDRMSDITLKEADELITRTDRYRADYYKYYTGGNYWTNPVNYDITLNNERLGDEKSVQIILQCMRIKFGDEWFDSYRREIGILD